jgi:hypothetical protein
MECVVRNQTFKKIELFIYSIYLMFLFFFIILAKFIVSYLYIPSLSFPFSTIYHQNSLFHLNFR